MRLATLAVLLAAGPTLAQEPVVLAPGHPDLAVEAVVPASRVVAVRNGEQVMGTVREDVRLDGGALTVVASTAVSMAGPPARDSTRLAWPSLAPEAHAVETDGRAGAVAYAAGAVEGAWDGTPLAFALERPVFAPAALPLVVRALPLDRTGYQAVVPLFSALDRFQEARLTVVGPEEVTLADGTTVEAVAVDQGGGGGLTRGFAQRHFVDPSTREIVATEITPPGMTVRIEPVAPDVAATVRPVRARPPGDPVALVPGHPDLAFGEVAPDSAAREMRYALPERRPLWRVTEAERLDGDTLTVVMTAEAAGDPARTVRDTTRYLWPSLAPVSQRRVVAGPDGEAVEALAFDGLRVTGEAGPAGRAPQPLDLELRAPAFGPRSVALVARALPFRAGYHATVPVFTAADRLSEHALVVVGRETVETAGGPVSAWVVEETGDGPTRRYFVDPETRALLSVTYSPALGTVIETVRL